MTRRRWLRAGWPFEIRELAARLCTLPFADLSQSGFILDRVRANYIEARFIERQEITQAVESPFGDTLTFERVEFSQIKFVASDEILGLEIRNAPRSLNVFLARLSEACNFDLSVVDIRTDVMLWVAKLAEHLEAEISVTAVTVNEIDLGAGTIASTLIKGPFDVRAAVQDFLGERRHRVSRVKLEIIKKPKLTLILSSQASMSSNRPMDEQIEESVRQALISSMGC